MKVKQINSKSLDNNFQLISISTIINKKKLNYKFTKKVHRKYLSFCFNCFLFIICVLIITQALKLVNVNVLNKFNFIFLKLALKKSTKYKIYHNTTIFVNTAKTIKIKYLDFWGGFSPNEFFIHNILSKRYNLTILNDSYSKLKPDYIIYSCFGKKY